MLSKVIGSGLLLPATEAAPVENRLWMTISSTSSVDPVFDAPSLADGDYVWTKPDGVTTFTGKAPASSNFDATGTYKVACSNWSAEQTFNCFNDNVTGFKAPTSAGMVSVAFSLNSVGDADLTGLTSLESIFANTAELTSLVLDPALTSLLSVYVPGSAGLTALPDLTGQPNLNTIVAGDCGISGALDLSGLTKLQNLQLNSCSSLTSVDISGCCTAPAGLVDYSFSDCGLGSDQVDAILIALDASGTEDGRLSLVGNSVPGPLGEAAIISLSGKDWYIET